MPFTIIFLLSTLSERFFYIDIGPLRLSVGDLCLLSSLPFLILVNSGIKKLFFYLGVSSFIVILSSIISNAYIFGFNSLITIPFRFIASYVILLELQRVRNPRYWKQVVQLLIYLMITCLLFFSDASIYPISDIFNRNELLAYIICCILLSNALKNKYKENISDQELIKQLFIILLLILLALVVGSRQHILSLLISMICLLLFVPLRLKLVGVLITLVMIVVSLPMITKNIVGNERSLARIETIIKFEASTRADKFRLNNIIQSINGFQERPLFGNGPTSFRRDNVYNKVAHSTPFSVAYELGSLGLFWLLVVFYFVLKPTFRTVGYFKNNNQELLVICFLPCVVIQSFFMELLPKAPLYIFLACSIFLIYDRKLRCNR